MLTTGYWYLEPAPQRHHASQDWQKLPSGIQIAVASRIKQGKAWTPRRACIFMARYYLSSHLHAPLPTTENKIISYVLMVWFTCQTLGAVTAGAWFWYLLRFSCAFCEWLVLSTEKGFKLMVMEKRGFSGLFIDVLEHNASLVPEERFCLWHVYSLHLS